MTVDIAPDEWALALDVFTARHDGTGHEQAEGRMIHQLGLERAYRIVSTVHGQSLRTGVPATLICEAGCTPVDDLPPAAPRALPVVTISTRPDRHAGSASGVPGRCSTRLPGTTPAAPRPPRVERSARPGGAHGNAVPGSLGWHWAGAVIVAGGLAMPVLLAVQIWRGTR